MSKDEKHGTALVTGASSGIGEAFAKQLAARGYGLVLVARREERLRALAGELRSRHGVAAEAVAADLATDEGVKRIEERIAAMPDLALLINNAGFGAGGCFHETDLSKQLAMIHVHVNATTRLARAALPGMVSRGKGAVINVSSIAGFAILPTGAMYCSTKAWIIAFTRAIAEELRGAGVRAQALCPGYTYTEFHDTPEFADFDRAMVPRFMWMKADHVVEASLKALDRDRVVCVPGFVNKAIVTALRCPFFMWVAQRYSRKRWRKRQEAREGNEK